MKETQIRIKAKKLLKNEGWIIYCPPHTRWHHGDIFTIGDGIGWRKNVQRLFQWTTKEHMPDHRIKILNYMNTNLVTGTVTLMGYDKKTRCFVREDISI